MTVEVERPSAGRIDVEDNSSVIVNCYTFFRGSRVSSMLDGGMALDGIVKGQSRPSAVAEGWSECCRCGSCSLEAGDGCGQASISF